MSKFISTIDQGNHQAFSYSGGCDLQSGYGLTIDQLLSPTLYDRPPTETVHIALINSDNSQSMYDSKSIYELEAVIPSLISDVNRDSTVRASVLMNFGHFGDERPLELVGPLGPVSELRAPKFRPSNGTRLCARIIASVALLIACKKLVRTQFNVAQRKAWLVEFTDGAATDKELETDARRAIQQQAMENGIDVFLFGVGRDADMSFLHSIEQPGRPAELLKGEKNFADLFRWIGDSMRVVSQTTPGRKTEILSVNGTRLLTQ